MGLFDTIDCDYPLPDARHQELAFQTKDLDRLLERYSITKDGRLIKHPRGWSIQDGGPPVVDRDFEVPLHGDLRMYDSDPDAQRGLIEYLVRFTHGRVEWIRRLEEAAHPGLGRTNGQTPPAVEAAPTPDAMGRPLTVEEFTAHAPEKLELVDGRIHGDKGLLLLILTSLGLRRAAALVGHETWKKGMP
jgi:hypothetical protein